MSTPLITAAESGDVASVAALIASGADLDVQDGRGRTAMMAATHANHPEVVALLIEAGADPT